MLAKAKLASSITFIVLASFTIVTYDRQNMFIIHATGLLFEVKLLYQPEVEYCKGSTLLCSSSETCQQKIIGKGSSLFLTSGNYTSYNIITLSPGVRLGLNLRPTY